MKSLLKKCFAITTLLVALLIPTLAPITVNAAPINDACKGIESAGGKCGTGNDDFNAVIKTVINVLTIVVGAVSVVMIIIGGFRYVVSNGDSNSVSGAKNTILYAVVGLVIALSAQLIVAFVINKS